MLNNFKKDKYFWGLVIIVSLVFVIRIWMFSDLLIFKMDQSRDIKLIEEAYNNGIGELPLLGPRAAKTYLRLGPIAYYFEYVSLLVFGDNPWAMAVPDFIFSILTIPLFYYFLRQVFNKKVSLMTVIIFATSFFLTQYSRFAWNPNAIPFWSVVYFLGLYKIVSASLVKKKNVEIKNYIGRWLLIVSVGYGVASQLHFTAMLAYPIIGMVFLIITWRTKWWVKISWQYWLGAMVILGIMYLPMVLSELHTHGDNLVQFWYALSEREREDFSLKERTVQSLKLHSEYFWFSLTSITKGASTWGVGSFTVLVFWIGVLFFKTQKIKIENKNSQKLFLLLILIWFGVMFLLYTNLAFSVLKPRYWLLEAPIFFVWIAFVLQQSMTYRNRFIKKSGYILVGALVIINLYAVGNWYWMLQNQQKSNLLIWDLKLKDENKIPWGQLQKSADYIEKLNEQTKKSVCFYTTGEYRPVYNYIFKRRGLENSIRRVSFSKDTNEKCLFLTINHSQNDAVPRIPKKHQHEFEKAINGRKKIGFVTIWVVNKINDQELTVEKQESVSKSIDNKNTETKHKEQNVRNGIQGRIIVEIDNKNKQNSKDKKISKKPKRMKRVRWKDIGNVF